MNELVHDVLSLRTALPQQEDGEVVEEAALPVKVSLSSSNVTVSSTMETQSLSPGHEWDSISES